jgi:Required for nuclear transport of RNA pol II C-terminus 2
MKIIVVLITLAAIGFLIFGILPQGPQQERGAVDVATVLEKSKAEEKDTRLSAILAVHDEPKLLENEEIFSFILSRLTFNDETERGAAEIVVQENTDSVVVKVKPFIESLEYQKYVRGAAAVRVIGPPSSIFVDVVGKRLRDSMNNANPANKNQEFNIRLSSLWALEAMGNAALPYLDDAIKVIQAKFEPGPEFNLRVAALRVLGSIGADAKSTLPMLAEFLEKGDPNLSERAQFLLTIGLIGPGEGLNVIELLTSSLDRNTHRERISSLEALGRLGPSAIGAKDKITELMNDPNKGVNPHAAVAYYLVTKDVTEPLKILEKSLGNPSLENDAIELSGRLGPAAAPLVPILKKKLDSVEAITREYAIVALKKIGIGSRDALSKLEKVAANDSDFLVREHARAAIAAIKINAK